jgi:hypothetical protein
VDGIIEEADFRGLIGSLAAGVGLKAAAQYCFADRGDLVDLDYEVEVQAAYYYDSFG